MSVLKYNCSLCCKNDFLLQNDFGLKAIRNTFFALNENDLDEALVKKAEFCIICTYKLQLSIQLKKEYDQMCNRNNSFNTRKCYFCESKVTKLINMNDNPNATRDKIRVFLNSVLTRHAYKDLKSCIKCLYNLDIWFEVRNNMYKCMNVSTTNAVRNEDASNNNVTSIHDTPTSSPSPKRRKLPPRRKIHEKNRKNTWKCYLHEKLKNLQTVDKLKERKDFILNSATIEDDADKLYKSLPFVEIFLNSQINKEIILENKEDVIPTIVLSDSDSLEDTMNKRRSVKRLNLSLKKRDTTPKNTPKQPNKSTPKNGSKTKKKLFKVKFPLKSRLSLNKETSESDSISVSKYSEDEASDTQSQDFTCDICDKVFTSKCDYLLHDLRHTKVETLVVNVKRDRLFEIVNTTDGNEKQERANVKLLLQKWLGDDAANQYEDDDEPKEGASKKGGQESEDVEMTEESHKKKPQDSEGNEDNEMDVDTIESSIIEEKTASGTNKNKNDETLETKNRDSVKESCNENKVSDKDKKTFGDDENNERSDDLKNSKSPGTEVKKLKRKKSNDETASDIEVEDNLISDVNSQNEKSKKKSSDSNKKSEKVAINIDFSDDSNLGKTPSPTPALSCEDLLNILETNIDSELTESDNITNKVEKKTESPTEDSIRKRKRDSTEDDAMPKKKKVRFAEKKEVFSRDKSTVVIEKLIVNDELSQNDDDETEGEEEKSEDEGEEIEEPEEEANVENESIEEEKNEEEKDVSEEEEKNEEDKDVSEEEEEENGKHEDEEVDEGVVEESGNKSDKQEDETEKNKKAETQKDKNEKIDEDNDEDSEKEEEDEKETEKEGNQEDTETNKAEKEEEKQKKKEEIRKETDEKEEEEKKNEKEAVKVKDVTEDSDQVLECEV